MENIVVLLLIAEAAQEAPADARNLGRVQEQVLFLRHFDGHWHELAQEPAAAAHHAAAPHSAEHLRLVPDADLAQFDAGVVLAHQILYQFTKVDPGRGGKVKHQLAAIEQDLHIDKLHVELAFPDARFTELVRGVRQGIVLFGDDLILVGHLAQDIAHTIRRKILRKAIHNVHDRGDAEALTGFRKYAIPSAYKGVLTVEKIYLSVMTEFYTDYALHVGALSAAGRTG